MTNNDPPVKMYPVRGRMKWLFFQTITGYLLVDTSQPKFAACRFFGPYKTEAEAIKHRDDMNAAKKLIGAY